MFIGEKTNDRFFSRLQLTILFIILCLLCSWTHNRIFYKFSKWEPVTARASIKKCNIFHFFQLKKLLLSLLSVLVDWIPLFVFAFSQKWLIQGIWDNNFVIQSTDLDLLGGRIDGNNKHVDDNNKRFISIKPFVEMDSLKYNDNHKEFIKWFCTMVQLDIVACRQKWYKVLQSRCIKMPDCKTKSRL